MKPIRISAINIYKKNLKLTRPYTIAFKTINVVENIFVEIHLDNRIIGLGACHPSEKVVGFSLEETFNTLKSEKINYLIGKPITDFYALQSWLYSSFSENPTAVAGIDIALYDAFTQYLKTPLVVFLGQKHFSLPTSITIGIKNVDDTINEAEEYIARGFTHLKVKLGLRYDEDIERLIKLREKYAPHIFIRVDANQGYSFEQTHHFFKAIEKLNIEFVEQPMSAKHLHHYKDLAAENKRKIALDESIVRVGDVLKANDLQALCHIINIKLMKCGGITGALQIADLAQHFSCDLMWGCNDESMVSITAALHTAFACSNTKYIDLDGSLDLAEDIVSEGFDLKNGMMSIPTKSNSKNGLGLKCG